MSDSEDYLTPSETEPDDPEMMSQYPVSKRQIKGLRENEKSRQRQFGDDVNNLPTYYSTHQRQRNPVVDKRCDKLGDRQTSKRNMSTLNHGSGKGNGYSDHSSDSDGSSDENNHRSRRSDDFSRRCKKKHKRETSVSSKGDESDGDEPYERNGRDGRPRRHGRHRNVSLSGDRSRDRRKGYMKPDKYEGNTCFETFLTQFSNCAEYNRWTHSEKLAYLRWSLKGSAAQMLWGARDMTYKQLVTRLRSRFGSADMEEHYRADLQCRRRKTNEQGTFHCGT